MAGQFGGGRLGGVALSAGTSVDQPFTNMVDGCIEALYLRVNFSLINTVASPFNAVVDTDNANGAAAEGVDDVDIVLNFIFTQIAFLLDAGYQVGLLSPAQWRTILGLLNQRDLTGTFMTGVPVIPSSAGSAKAFYIQFRFPLSLQNYFQDGGIFRQGSTRLKDGLFTYYTKNTSGNVVLANGTATVSAVSVAVTAETGPGTQHDVGPSWKVQRIAGLQTVYTMGMAKRIAVLDTLPTPTNTVSAYNVMPFYEVMDPTYFGSKYQSERLPAGGFDVTARTTPLLWIDPNRTFNDFLAGLGEELRIDAISGVASQTLYDIQISEPSPSTIAKVATKVGAGGPVSVVHPSPLSLPPGSPIAAPLQSLLPHRILPGAIDHPSATAHTNPAAAAQGQVNKNLKSENARNVFRLFGSRK